MSWLKELEAEWKDASNRVGDLPKTVSIPDGPQKAVIVDASVDEDRPMIRFVLEFPDFSNIRRTKVVFVSGKLEYVQRELSVVGCNVDKPEDLPLAVRATIGMVVEVAVRTKPGEKYSKMYFNRDLGERYEVDLPEDLDNPMDW